MASYSFPINFSQINAATDRMKIDFGRDVAAYGLVTFAELEVITPFVTDDSSTFNIVTGDIGLPERFAVFPDGGTAGSYPTDGLYLPDISCMLSASGTTAINWGTDNTSGTFTQGAGTITLEIDEDNHQM